MTYFDVYKSSLKKGLSEERATLKAINYGISLEKTILGFWASGVFSFGDLEANYQGLLFNLRFCDDKRGIPYLKIRKGKWVLESEIDIKDYIKNFISKN